LDTTVKHSQEILQRLEADLAKATDRATALQVERRKLSFAAHSGDKPSRAKLDKLNGESVTAGLEIENLMAAADEAKSRVAAAEHQAVLAEQRAKAKEVMSLAEHAAKRGARIRDLTLELAAEVSGAVSDLRRFGSLGAPIMNARLLELALTRSVLPGLREAGIDCDLIPPGNHHQADAVVDGYVAQATTWADGVLLDEILETM
jgi:hypothetical protein